ncbi:cytochrome P450 [Wolfiporia cocos MD-104 SS10]|uniref:Cytochrome P450 n=1 Tax=Wolfiporia cocos (strain MD-104) TaxID=742152 RepID=A0A2H3JAG7_WOLCO|nr:cytochrome P450 [Wolfiporia cocos MD-104 SS10]
MSIRAWQISKMREVGVLLSSLLDEPERFMHHIRRFTAALIMEITYGYTVTSADDKYVALITEAMNGVTESGSTGATLVDFFPVLKYIPSWLPGAGFKRNALAVRRLVEAACDGPYEWTKRQVESGTAKPSILSYLIEESMQKGTLPRDKIDIRGVGGAVFGAGTDTVCIIVPRPSAYANSLTHCFKTSSVLLTFFLAMTLHPHVLPKAQEEIDRVVGSNRLPEFTDRETLPYVECVVNELYRWNTVAPLGIPHCVTEHDEYLGYHIPKGTMVVPNIWSMSQNERIYPDPQRFCPERFVGMSEKDMEVADPRNYVFGFGRRICPGRQFADTSIWIVVACMIATLNIRKARDSSGKEITPSAYFVSGITRHPNPFMCIIEPRSEKARALIIQYKAAFDG